MSLTQAIKQKALQLGFDRMGVAPAEPVPDLQYYIDWVEAGYAGEMGYMERDPERRSDVTRVVPQAKSVVVCAMNYHTDYPLSTERNDPQRGWISRYAWGDDYHDLLADKLRALFQFMQEQSPEEVVGRLYVDTGPVLERVYAKYAGIGWFGKNTCTLNQEMGSWFFLGEIITNLELGYDQPVPERCGTCTRCLDACPTDAFVEPYVLDARRCISYLTIELKDDIPVELREGMGDHIYGCDICQDVCPWNRKAPVSLEPAFQPRPGLFDPDLEELAQLTPEAFREKFHGSPIKRTKRRGLLRNIAVAMGNSGDARFIPMLEQLLAEEPVVARHAGWALDKLRQEPEDTTTDVALDELQV